MINEFQLGAPSIQFPTRNMRFRTSDVSTGLIGNEPTRVLLLLLLTVACGCACPTKNLSKQAAKRGDSVSILPVTPERAPDESRKSPDTRLFQIAGDSMEPRYHSASVVRIAEYEEGQNLKRGSVIVFRRPEAERRFFAKRIIGLPGETVEVHNGNVYVFNERFPNGAVLDETAYMYECEHTSGNHRWQLDEGEYIVLGDHRSQSTDSRKWGPLQKRHIEGWVLQIVEHPRP